LRQLVRLPWAADSCPWVGKLRTVLPLKNRVIRDSAVQLGLTHQRGAIGVDSLSGGYQPAHELGANKINSNKEGGRRTVKARVVHAHSTPSLLLVRECDVLLTVWARSQDRALRAHTSRQWCMHCSGHGHVLVCYGKLSELACMGGDRRPGGRWRDGMVRLGRPTLQEPSTHFWPVGHVSLRAHVTRGAGGAIPRSCFCRASISACRPTALSTATGGRVGRGVYIVHASPPGTGVDWLHKASKP
jgi:hypothetical protein